MRMEKKKRSSKTALMKASNTVSTQLIVSIIVGTSVAKSEKRATAQRMLRQLPCRKELFPHRNPVVNRYPELERGEGID